MTIRRSAPRADSAGRRPRQERGQRRVEAILDAAAEAVAESGVARLTMQDVGRRSGTTAGSLYHFFPDREAVLHALGERHARRLEALAATLRATPQAEWARLATPLAVDRFLDPFLGYLADHPDLLQMMRADAPARPAGRDPALDAALVSLAACVIGARCPQAEVEERRARAATTIAIVEGLVGLVARAEPSGRARLTAELKRALVAYFDACADPPPA